MFSMLAPVLLSATAMLFSSEAPAKEVGRSKGLQAIEKQMGMKAQEQGSGSALSYADSHLGLGYRGFESAQFDCPSTGSFEWLYFSDPPACTRALGNVDFYEALDKSFNKCAERGAIAAGVKSPSGQYTGKVIHKGLIGDASHKDVKPGQNSSLHNVGRAIDIQKIEVNGELFVFDRASEQFASGVQGKEFKFFKAFRACWAAAAKASNKACGRKSQARGDQFGSLGWEDDRHQHHLHISLPVCDKKGFKAVYLEYQQHNIQKFLQFMMAAATAATPRKPDKVNLELKSGDMLRGTAVFEGEPVDRPVVIKLSVECKKERSSKILEKGLNACNFMSLQEDEEKNIVLTTTEPKFDDSTGTLKCADPKIHLYKNPCETK